MVGFRSTLATPRIPSVPNRRAIRGSAARSPRGVGLVEAGGVAVPLIVTLTVDGLAATSVGPVGRSMLTGTSTVPGPRPVTSRSTTRADPASRSRSALDPPMVTMTRSVVNS